jgi:hypothetical protein
VSGPPACLSILLLTEDSAKEAHDTLASLAKRMLQIIVPRCGTHRIEIKPANDEAKRAMHANLWKSDKPRDHRKLTDLRRTIATKISEADPPGFVFFHADGDRSWSLRATSENRQKFSDRIRHGVEQLVVSALERKAALEEREATMARLHLLMPFYSIESWLYQNGRAAIAICHAEHGGQDAERFEAWESDRGALDEVEKPKEQTCLGSRHNLRLAKESFPTDAVYEAKKSFEEAVDGLFKCSELVAALERTTAS